MSHVLLVRTINGVSKDGRNVQEVLSFPNAQAETKDGLLSVTVSGALVALFPLHALVYCRTVKDYNAPDDETSDYGTLLSQIRT